MRFPSNKTLAKVAVYGGVASISGVMYLTHKFKERIRNQEFFVLAMRELRQHNGAVRLLGEPIKEVGFDLTKTDKNYCDSNFAKFEIAVKGTKDRGKVFFSASNDAEKGWQLNRLELELKSDPDKRYLLKKD